MAVLAGCTPPGPLSEGEGTSPDSPAAARHPLSEGERLPRPAATPSQRGTTAHEALEGIDSLMWKEADSALKVMMEFAASPEADSLDVFEGHYCQVLVGELLFKNYYKQSNREEVLKAVGYFDSIVGIDGADIRGKADTRGASVRERDAFLAARAHYINGVGYYFLHRIPDHVGGYGKPFRHKRTGGHKSTVYGVDLQPPWGFVLRTIYAGASRLLLQAGFGLQ